MSLLEIALGVAVGSCLGKLATWYLAFQDIAPNSLSMLEILQEIAKTEKETKP